MKKFLACFAAAFLALSLNCSGRSAIGEPMPTQVNGNAANIVGSLTGPVAIAGSSATNPAIIVTSAAHGLTSGDTVTISGSTVNTSINGDWSVTVTGPSTFTIPVLGTAIGANGIVQSRALGPIFPIPSDGDSDAAASVDVAFKSLGDRTAALGTMTGALRIADLFAAVRNDDTFTEYEHFNPSMSANTWTDLVGATVFQPLVLPVNAGDLIDIDTAFNSLVIGGTGSVQVAIMSVWAAIGSGSYTKITGSDRATYVPTSAEVVSQLTPSGLYVCPAAGVLSVKVRGMAVTTNNFVAWALSGDYTVKATRYVATQMPQ